MKRNGKVSIITHIVSFIIIVLLGEASCLQNKLDTSSGTTVLKKINFDLNEIDKNGMIGPPDGKREMAYEFCIPLDKAKRKEVSSIDKSVQFFNGPSGRIGCDDNQYLCIGSGGNRQTIVKLASLNYIKKIDPFYGE